MFSSLIEAPRLLELPKLGSESIGYLSVAQQPDQIPFPIKRVYWTYNTPTEVTRGNHAHRELRQLIVAVAGQIKLTTENLRGEKQEFRLDSPSKGLIIPPWHWRTIQLSDAAVLLCLASEVYEKSDYIYSFEEFVGIQKSYREKYL